MRFFDFSKYNSAEKELLDGYIQLYISIGMSPEDVKLRAEGEIDRAIEKSKQAGTYDFPQKIGDIILGDSETNDNKVEEFVNNIRQKIPLMRKEGITDEDIRFYWNLFDLERWAAIEMDTSMQQSCYDKHIERGLSSNKAKSHVKKILPIYGDINDLNDKDRPLPYELKNRVNSYMVERGSTDTYKYKQDMDKSSSFNALVRKGIKVGNL